MPWLPATDDDEPGPDALCAVTKCKRLRNGRWTLCLAHGTETGQFLAAIGDDILHRLDPRLTMQAPSGEGVSGGNLKSHRGVANLDVLSITDRRSQWRSIDDPDGNNLRSPLEVLHAYATEVRDGCGLVRSTRTLSGIRAGGLYGPACTTCEHESCVRRRPWPDITVEAEPTVATERKLLRDHLDWCLAQDFAADMWRELRQVDRALGNVDVTRDPDAQPRRQGVHAGCGGQLWYAPAAGGEKARGWCTDCGKTWTGLQLAALSKEAAA